MKHLKIYENFNDVKAGDYVIMKFKHSSNQILKNFLKNNIGKIELMTFRKDLYGKDEKFIYVNYDKVPFEIRKEFIPSLGHGYTKTFKPNEIVEFAKTKEDLETKISANKYNI